MNPILLYLLLLKATMTSFSGLSSVPVLHNDLIVQRHLLTERQLNTAIAAGRSGPGPLGLYVVSVGYQAGGVMGAAAGFLAVVTPAFLVIPILRFMRARASHPRLRGAIQGILLCAAGLLVYSSIPIAQASLLDTLTVLVAIGTFFVMVFTRVDTVWVMLAAGVTGATAGLLHQLAGVPI